VVTAPRLPDGTPFPTTYYLTCPVAVAACSRLEAGGLMADMTARLAVDGELRTRYEQAHDAYRRDRADVAASLGIPDVPRAGDSAGGMPGRVKCLHALVGHALAAGPGVNPFGDEAVAAIGEFWRAPCLGDSAVRGGPASSGGLDGRDGRDGRDQGGFPTQPRRKQDAHEVGYDLTPENPSKTVAKSYQAVSDAPKWPDSVGLPLASGGPVASGGESEVTR